MVRDAKTLYAMIAQGQAYAHRPGPRVFLPSGPWQVRRVGPITGMFEQFGLLGRAQHVQIEVIFWLRSGPLGAAVVTCHADAK